MMNVTPNKIEAEILSVLDTEEAISLENLRKKLDIDDVSELSKLSEILVDLQKKYKISTTKKGKFLLFDNPTIKIGRLEIKKRSEDNSVFGFVVVEDLDKDIFVNGKNLNGAIDGEIVRVDIVGGRKDKPEGKIIEIVEKKQLNNLVGEVYFDNKGKLFVELDDKRLGLTLEIVDNNIKAVSGHKVLVKVNRDNKAKRSDLLVGEIAKILGHKDEPGVDVLSIAYAHGFTNEWPKEVMEELKYIPNKVLENEILKRRDLREEQIFTIDGDDTKDIDDAVSVKQLANGNYLLGVHIANVSQYVKKGSAIDKEAYKRATSIYMVDTVIPMLPPQLSNGICSLNPNVDRLAVSCEMEIDKQGEIVNRDIFASVINSKKQMSYKNVNLILEKNIVPEDYIEFENDIKMLNDVALILRKSKKERGMLEFSSKEVKFIFDENKIPIEIVKREQRAGEKLIEDLMIAANETVASYFQTIDYPSVYRVHETPDEEKVAELVNIVLGLGLEIPNKNKKFNLYPKAFQELIEIIKEDEKIFKLISPIALRTQRKAIYSPYNEGHFGLASECYTHFTSPIRRYPDKQLHEIIEHAIFNTDFSKKTISKLEENLPIVCEHSSIKEKEAEKCEREADDMKTAEFMSYHIGEEFHGVVSGVTRDALYVELDNNAEGRLHISELTDDEYTFNPEFYRLEGKTKGKSYSFGDELDIVVKAASKENMKVDFGMAELIKDEIPKKKIKKLNYDRW